jgi:hypothetical protein
VGAVVAAAAIVWFLAACEGGAGRPAAVERDSAGIPILENRADTAALRAGWSIDPDPLVTIGGLQSDSSQQLYQVSGGVRLADGRIAIANGGSSDIRVYGPNGSVAAIYGRQGEGPGEFTSPQLAGVIGDDSLIVFDSQLRRISILDADTGYVRSVLVGDEGGGFPLARGALGDGDLLLGGGMYFSSANGFPSGLTRPPSRYLVVGLDGEAVGDFGEIPAAEMFAKVSSTGFSARLVPFGKITAIAATSDRIWLGTGETWEIRAFRPDATLARIVRFDRAQAPVTASLVEAFVEEQVADARDPNEVRTRRAFYAEMPTPSSVPPYELFAADALDVLWIGEYLLPGKQRRTWTLADSTGRAIGRVTTPARTVPLDIGPDWLLAVTRDEYDVESVTLWRLHRPAA